MITTRFEPGQIGFGGNAGIHRDRRPFGRSQVRQHILQRLRLAGVAAKYPAPADKPAAVEYHR